MKGGNCKVGRGHRPEAGPPQNKKITECTQDVKRELCNDVGEAPCFLSIVGRVVQGSLSCHVSSSP
jgi:hypothetical protein